MEFIDAEVFAAAELTDKTIASGTRNFILKVMDEMNETEKNAIQFHLREIEVYMRHGDDRQAFLIAGGIVAITMQHIREMRK